MRSGARFPLVLVVAAAACNLWPQFAEDATSPAPVAPVAHCAARPIAFSDRGLAIGNGAAIPSCRVDAQGSATLAYDPPPACSVPEPYRGCVVAAHQDLRPFLAGDGIFAVHVCVTGSVDGALNLWIEDAAHKSAPGGRYALTLIGRAEPFSSTCRRVWLRAADLLDGAPGDAGADAGPTFADSDLALVAEWCVPAKTPTSPGHVAIALLSATYYPPSCMCRRDEECASVCARDGWPDSAQCARDDAGCPGLCGEALSASP
jgi:hypothetical protein